MRTLPALLFTGGIIFLISCMETNNTVIPEAPKMEYFGEKISNENISPASELSAMLEGKDSLKIKVSGKITDVCQKKGCWMDVDLGGKVMKVRFKDYGFFVPKDAAGKETVIEGFAFRDTTTVEELRHYAEDEGLTGEEINTITEPEINISFEAIGVIIK